MDGAHDYTNGAIQMIYMPMAEHNTLNRSRPKMEFELISIGT